jgi:hypothetical protein
LPSKMMNGGIAYPLALTASIVVTYFRFPGCFVLGLPFLSDDVITFEVKITPIWKLVSLKLKMSSSVTPYFAIVSPTSLNYKLISFGSSTSALWISNFRLYTLESSGWRFTKLVTHFVPTL